MLTSRKFIITGAASGIGKEIKQSLREGASVTACDIDESSLNALKQSMNHVDNLHTCRLDVSEYEEVAKFFKYVKTEHANVDSLVNNAGIYFAKNILDYEVDEINTVLNVNVKGYIFHTIVRKAIASKST